MFFNPVLHEPAGLCVLWKFFRVRDCNKNTFVGGGREFGEEKKGNRGVRKIERKFHTLRLSTLHR